MRRKYIKEGFTDDELQNMKDGKCWCGKPRSEFQKGMRVYCSPEHRSIWQSKVLTWQEFRDRFLREHGEKCDTCGVESPHAEYERLYGEKKKERLDALMSMKSELQDGIIATRLERLESDFEYRFTQAIDPSTIDEYELERYAKSHKIPLPELPPWRPPDEKPMFEVDHIVAIVNGGGEFDHNNLQVLCHECHKKKTKSDMQIADGLNINMTNTQTSIEEALE
jgi:hypothetical protein